MPVLQPAELWKKTGRYEIDELFKLRDRRGAELVLGDDPRGGHHLPRVARDPLLPRPAQAALPLPDQGARRAAPARRGAAHARVHHEGLLLVRPRRGGPRRVLRAPHQGLRRDLRPHRARVVPGRGRRGDDGRLRRPRVHGALRRRRERRRAVGRPATPPTWRSRAATPQPVDGLPEALAAPEPVETPGATTIEAVAGMLGVPAGRADQGAAGGRRGPRAGAGAGARRPPPQRDQAPERARRAGPARGGARRCATLFGTEPGFIGPVGAQRRRGRRRGAARPARPRDGRQRAGHCTCAAWSPGRDFEPDLGGRAPRRGRRPLPERRRDPHRARHRGGQHLQARHALLRAARRALPRRAGQGAADRDGLLRDRPGAHRGGRDRAVPRRAGHLLAARAGALRHRADHARQGGRGGPHGRRPPLRRAARGGPRRALRRPRRQRGREVRRRRAARLPAAAHDRQARARGGRGRRPDPARPGTALAAARRRRARRPRSLWASLP